MTREERRKLMPFTTEIVALVREEFGTPARIEAHENGHSFVWEPELIRGETATIRAPKKIS